MTRIDAATFAREILVAEGFGDAVPYETKWLRHFEKMFVDVFGDEPLLLDDNPSSN